MCASSEMELEVMEILCELPDLVRRFGPGLPDILHWATKKPRSVPAEDPPAAGVGAGDRATKKPRSVPAEDPPAAGVGAGDRAKGGAGTSSPTNPLSFDPSREEGEAIRAVTAVQSKSRPARMPSAAVKNAKQHIEWVNEQNQKIASLLASIVNLERALVEAKGRQQRLKGRNAWLKEMRSRAKVALGTSEAIQQQQQPAANNLVGPTSFQLQLGPANNQVGPSGFRLQPGTVGPRTAVFASPKRLSHQMAAVGGGRLLLDLNAKAEEEYEEIVTRMDIAAAQAQARKRRMEKQRERGQRAGKRVQMQP